MWERSKPMTEPKTIALEMVNTDVRFVLELAVSGIEGYWRCSIGQTHAVKLGLGSVFRWLWLLYGCVWVTRSPLSA